MILAMPEKTYREWTPLIFGLKCYPLKTKGMLLITLDEVEVVLVENLAMSYRI
jgi:hypothetical protein